MALDAECARMYEKARQAGQKTLRANAARHVNGYVPVLDDLVDTGGVLAIQRLGQREIPLRRVAGTSHVSRAHAFSADFMPLQPPNTEFANKWIRLCSAQMEEGLRDPIQVYEYMWRYYVTEGNKRVSLLKYMDAFSYQAEISRLIPEWDDCNADTERYFAFLEYAKHGLFSAIELSAPDKYIQLYHLEQRLLESAPPMTDFDKLLMRFEAACAAASCPVLPGDALLEHLRLYGLPLKMTIEELTARVVAMRPQLMLLNAPAEPKIIMAVQTAPKLAQLLSRPRNTHIVFAHDARASISRWRAAHEHGRRVLEEALGGKITTAVIPDLDAANAVRQLNEGAADAGLLFVTTPTFREQVLRFSLDHAECLTLTCARMQDHHKLDTYFGRYHEAMYLCGVAAGLSTRSRCVAYISSQPTCRRCTADINAFALGVRAVSDARILFITKDVEAHVLASCRTAMQKGRAQGADVVFTPVLDAFDLSGVPPHAFSALFTMDENGPARYIASPGWNWDKYYIKIVNSYLNGSLHALRGAGRENGVISFWWGMDEDIIGFDMADNQLDPSAAHLMRYLQDGLRTSRFLPFLGPVADADGRLMIAEQQNPRPLDVMQMDWLTAGIEEM
ncbi:MAG: hypothetical protein Q4E65_09155 [Clostridia bacterium]|nr:hypothetical protein [Clostridia bacterium]